MPRLFDSLAEAAKAAQADVFQRLGTSGEGLAWTEAQRRLEQFGPNELSAQKPPGWPLVLWSALKHPFNAVLGVLAVISLATGDLKAAVVMVTMITLSVGLRFWQEMKSQVQAESLRKLVHTEATVLRTQNAGVNRKPNAFTSAGSETGCRPKGICPHAPTEISPVQGINTLPLWRTGLQPVSECESIPSQDQGRSIERRSPLPIATASSRGAECEPESSMAAGHSETQSMQ